MSRTHRALVMLGLCLALGATTTAVAAQPTSPTIEDQHDRRLRQLEAKEAARIQAAVELYRKMERNVVPVSPAGSPAAAPTGSAMPSPGVDVLATLLVGLVGGLVGGVAALAGWTATTRRRVHRAASAT